MINDIKVLGFKGWLVGFLFYSKFAIFIKRIVICNRKGHEDDSFSYCINCWQQLDENAI